MMISQSQWDVPERALDEDEYYGVGWWEDEPPDVDLTDEDDWWAYEWKEEESE